MRKKINEADIRNLSGGIPKSFIDAVVNYARSEFNAPSGPLPHQGQRHYQLMGEIQQLQRGHHEELTQIALDLIQQFYGSILEGVKIDAKIVNPDDEEKREMVDKMAQNEEEAQEEIEEMYGEEIDVGPDPDPDKVAKRKILNNIIQGEAQNVHGMISAAKDQIDAIAPGLTAKYLEFLELNRLYDWMDRMNLGAAIQGNPDMANANEVEWDEEDGDDVPTIKARGLDLPITIHEVVKGIYELIASGDIDPDPVAASKIMAQTDTLEDESEDIKFGPFIAGAVREYINEALEDVPEANNVDNIREYVFGYMIKMEADEFLSLMEAILTDDQSKKRVIIQMLQDIVAEQREYERESMEYDLDKDDDDDSGDDIDYDDDIFKGIGRPDAPPSGGAAQAGGTNYGDMSQPELQQKMDQALGTENYEEAQKISKYLRENFNKIVGETLYEYEVMTAPTAPAPKPGIAPPKTKPGVRPGKPTPIPGKRPSVDPRPKATLDDVIKRFVSLVDL